MQISNKTALSYFRFHFILALQERYRGTTRRAKSSVALYRLTFITKDASKKLAKPKKHQNKQGALTVNFSFVSGCTKLKLSACNIIRPDFSSKFLSPP